MAVAWNLRNFKIRNLFEEVIGDNDQCIEWMRQHNLLANIVFCTSCNGPTREGYSHQNQCKRIWRCMNQQCRKKFDHRIGSFFKSHIPVKNIMHLIYMWAKEDPLYAIEEETGLSHSTIVDWCNFIRDICYQKSVQNFQSLGGVGTVVEIDESKFVKRKYNVGRRLNHTQGWVFGGIERNTRLCFLMEVPSKDAATLIPLIQRHILPVTTIHSDEWAAYRGLTRLGYDHQTVNHSQNFVNPVTGVHTQNVESMWSRAKKKFRKMHSTSIQLRSTYLNEFMWRSEFGEHAFHNILEHLANIYRVN